MDTNKKDNENIIDTIRHYRSRGMGIKMIAEKLNISETSVREYTDEIKRTKDA